jgi:pimeloyl-ACP methyl ester carboxylesterase
MKLFSRISGQGQPLLIIHGLFGMSDNWQSIGRQFSDFFEVHLIDLRNHGRSPHSSNFNYDVMVEDLVKYITERELSKVILMGHSLGGKTVMELAVKHSELVEKLIVVDIAPKAYPVHHDLIIEGLNKLNFNEIKSRAQADQLLAQEVKEQSVRQFLLKSLYWKEKKRLAFRFNLYAIASHIKEVGRSLAHGTAYSKACLFVDGADSSYINEEDEDLILIHFPNAEIITINDAGHWVHAQQPKQFYETILRFCLTA